MKAKIGDLVIYQLFIPGQGKNYWETKADIIKNKEDLEYYNKTGRFKDILYYIINYVIPAEELEDYKVNELHNIFDKMEGQL